jgi:hypothetical protein
VLSYHRIYVLDLTGNNPIRAGYDGFANKALALVLSGYFVKASQGFFTPIVRTKTFRVGNDPTSLFS